MGRLGWAILALIVLAGLAFGSMLTFGGVRPPFRSVAPVPPSAPRMPVGGMLIVPVAGVTRASLVDSWGDPRENGLRRHHGTDVPAPLGTPVIAAGPGRIEKLFTSVRGGLTVYQRSADGGWIYYYAHLAGYAPGLHEGQAVGGGEQLAYVGDTGDAEPGNTHLHFGLTRMRPGERWWEGEDVDPYPHLRGR